MEEITNLLVVECQRRLRSEGLFRIKKCLSELSEQEIWHKPNEHSNSIGNLVLHLCGNVRQWIVSGLGGRENIRNRPLEFSEKGPIPYEELIQRLENVLAEVDEVLLSLKPQMLTQKVTVQGFEETGLTVITHVIEHFSYHVGQITYYVKWLKNKEVGYYEDQDLSK